jgi:hypothetical protein
MAESISSRPLLPSIQLKKDYRRIRSGVDVSKALERMRGILDTHTPEELGMKPEEHQLFLQYASSMGPTIDVLDTTISSSGSEKPSISSAHLRELEGQIKVTLMNHIGSLGSLDLSHDLNGNHFEHDDFEHNEKVQHFLKLVKANLIKLAETSLDESLKEEIYDFNEQTNSKELLSQLNALLKKINNPKSGLHILNINSVLKRELDTLHRYFLAIELAKEPTDSSKQDLLYSELLFLNSPYEQQKLVEALFENGNEDELKKLFKGLFKDKNRGSSTERLKVARHFIEMLTEAKQDERFKSGDIEKNIQTIIVALSDDILSLIIDVTASQPKKGQYQNHINFLWNVLVGGGDFFIDTLKSKTSFSDLETLLNSKDIKADTLESLEDVWSAFHKYDYDSLRKFRALFGTDKLSDYKKLAESEHNLYGATTADKIKKSKLDNDKVNKIIGILSPTHELFEDFQSVKKDIDEKLAELGPDVDKEFSGDISFKDVVYITLFQRLPVNIKKYIHANGPVSIGGPKYYPIQRTHNFSRYCQSLMSKENSDGLTGIVKADWILLNNKGMKVAFEQLLNHLDDDKKKTDGSTVIDGFFEALDAKFKNLTDFEKLQFLDMLYRIDESDNSYFKKFIDKLDEKYKLAELQFLRSGFIDTVTVQSDNSFAVTHDFKLQLNNIILAKEKKEKKEQSKSTITPSTTISLRDIEALEQQQKTLIEELNHYQQGRNDFSDLMKRCREFEKLCLYHKKHHLDESFKTKLDAILEDFVMIEIDTLTNKKSPSELDLLHLELLKIRKDSNKVDKLLENLNRMAPTVPIELRYLFDHVKHSVVQKSFKHQLDQFFDQSNTDDFVKYINDHAAFITATPELACDFLNYFTEKCSEYSDRTITGSGRKTHVYNLLAAMFMNVESDLSVATVLDQLLSKAESAQHRQAVLPNFYRSFAGLIARSSKEGTSHLRLAEDQLDDFFERSIRGLALEIDKSPKEEDNLFQKIDLKSIEWLAKYQSKLDVLGVEKSRRNKKNKTQFPTYEFNKLLDRCPFLGGKRGGGSLKVDFFDPFFQRLDVKTQDFILKHVFSSQYHIEQIPKKKVEADYKCLRHHLKTYDKRKPKQHHIIVSMFEAFDKANKGQSLGRFSSITYIVDDLEKFLLKDIVHNQGHVLRDLLKKLDENGFLYKEILKSTAAIFTAKGSISPGSGHRRPDYYYENLKEFVRVSALDPELSSKINTFYSQLIEKVSFDGGADVKDLMDAFNIKAKGKRLSKDYFYKKLKDNKLKGQNGQIISRSRADSLYDFFIKKGYLTMDGRVSESGFPNKFKNFEVLDGLSANKSQIFNIVKEKFNDLPDAGANSSFLLELEGFNLDGLNRLIENGYIRKVGHKWEVLRYVDFNASLISPSVGITDSSSDVYIGDEQANILQKNFDDSVDYFWNQVSDSDSDPDINYKRIVIEFLKRRDYIRDNQLYFHEDHNLEEIASSIGRILEKKDPLLASQYGQDKIKNHLTQLATSFSVQSPKQVQLMQHLIRSTEGRVFLDTSSKQSRALFARYTSPEHSMALDQSIRRAGDISDKSFNYSMLNDWMKDSNINETAMVISKFFNVSELGPIQQNMLYGLSYMSLDQLAKLLLNTHLSETARNRILDSIDVSKLASLSRSLEKLYSQPTYENNFRELFQCLDTIKSIAYRRNLRGDKNQIKIQLNYNPKLEPKELNSKLKQDFIKSFSNFTNQPPSSGIFDKMIEFLNNQNLDLQTFLSLASSMTLASDSRRGYVGLFLKAISEEVKSANVSVSQEAKSANVSVSECLLSHLYKSEDFDVHNHHFFEHQMRSLFRLMKTYKIEVDLKKEFDFLDLSFHDKLKRIEDHKQFHIKGIPDAIRNKLNKLHSKQDVDKLGDILGDLGDLSRYSSDVTSALSTLDGLRQKSGRFIPRDDESNLGDEASLFGDDDSIAGG